MSDTITGLFTDLQGGAIVCFKHLGGYGQAAVKAEPNAPMWLTPLDLWAPISEKMRAEWLAEMGAPITCESCDAS